ncbi:unnamed protein product [Phytomonas sp. EM1]|nr:unnamed protein product [Phytomonas sp. EM1]|eukprot:CCW62761.1 unnamed protein product [Phytomonas sp. isolate EM1]
MPPSRSWVSLSDKEVLQELQNIVLRLSTKAVTPVGRRSSEWQLRLSALQELQACTRADLSQRRNFIQIMSSLFKVPLLEQLEDKRSKIVRAACEVIRDFVIYSTNRMACALLSSWYVPTLLRLTGSTVSVIAHAAGEVLHTILNSGGCSIEAFNHVLKSCCARHAVMRANALEMLATVLQQAKGTSQQLPIASYSAPIRRVLREGLTDGDSRVRQAARTCYWAFFAMEPSDAEVLLHSLPKAVGAVLNDAKAVAFQHMGAVQPTESGAPEGASDPTGNSHTAGQAASTSPREFSTGPKSAALREAATLAEGRREGRETSIALCEDLRAVAARKARALLLRRARLAINPSYSPSGERFALQPASRSAFSTFKGGPFQSRIGNEEEAARGLQGGLTERHPNDGVTRALTPERWAALKQPLASGDWRARLEVIHELRRIYAYLDDPIREECISEMVCHLDDPHFRIREATLEFLIGLPDQSRIDVLHRYMVEMVSVLIMNTNSPKGRIQGLSRQLLAQLITESEAEVIMDVFLHCAASASTPNLRKRATEALQFIFVKHSSYFHQTRPMLRVLSALARQLSMESKRRSSSGGSGGWQATVNALLTLYAVAHVSFLRSLRGLEDGEAQGLLREALSSDLPDLEGDSASATHPPQERFRRENLVPPPFRAYLKGARGAATEAVRSAAHPESLDPTRGGDILRSSSSLSGKRNEPRRPMGSLMGTSAPLSSGEVRASAGVGRYFASSSPPIAAFNAVGEGYHSSDDESDVIAPRLFPDSYRSARKVTIAAVHPPLTRAASSAPEPKCRADGHAQRAKTDLFNSPFSIRQFVDPCEELCEPLPEMEAAGSPRRRGTLPKQPPLMGGRRWIPADEGDVAAGFLLNPSSPQDLIAELLHSRDFFERCEALERIRSSLHESDAHFFWAEEEVAPRLLVVMEQYCTEALQPNHRVRRRGFLVLQTIIELPFMRPLVARKLARLLRYCRIGIDDAFVEVQQEAARTMHQALVSCKLPQDLCLNSLAACLEGWQRGPARCDSTRGWLEILNEVGRLFERIAGLPLKQGRGSSSTLTGSILRRVVHVLQWCVDHCAEKVRHASTLAFVAMWNALGSSVLPFLVPLTVAQRELVTAYHNKAFREAYEFCDQAPDYLFPERGSVAVERGEGPLPRDLDAEMRAMGLVK